MTTEFQSLIQITDGQVGSISEIVQYALETIEDFRQTFTDAQKYALQAAFALYADNNSRYDYYLKQVYLEELKTEAYLEDLVVLTTFNIQNLGINEQGALKLSPWVNWSIILDYADNYRLHSPLKQKEKVPSQ
jgi:hypothetical protein